MKFQDAHRIAAHEVEVTGTVVRLVLCGDFLLDDARRYAELIDVAITGSQPYAVIADVSAMAAIGPDVRRYLTEWNKGHLAERCAIIGANLISRTLVSLVVRAMSLASSAHINLRFFSSDADAEAWIAAWQQHKRGAA